LFYEWWETPGFKKILVPASGSKRITPKFLKHMRSVTRSENFAQEFNGKFISGAECPYFPGSVVDQCLVEPDGDAPPTPLKEIS
jgi:hypothetical protein